MGQNSQQEQFLYLTTVGRNTGQPREIEIWFVCSAGRFYIMAEGRGRANWVRNIQHNPAVGIRIAGQEMSGTARVLDPHVDTQVWETARGLMEAKYGWGDGLPVEIQPSPPLATRRAGAA